MMRNTRNRAVRRQLIAPARQIADLEAKLAEASSAEANGRLQLAKLSGDLYRLRDQLNGTPDITQHVDHETRALMLHVEKYVKVSADARVEELALVSANQMGLLQQVVKDLLARLDAKVRAFSPKTP